MVKHRQCTMILTGLVILWTVCLFLLYPRLSSALPSQRSSFAALVHSGLVASSFNPTVLHFSLNRAYFLALVDNQASPVHFMILPKTRSIRVILSDGFHRLDIRLFDPTSNVHVHQQVDIAVGTRSLIVTVLDHRNEPVHNVSVRVELAEHPQIALDLRTNRTGKAEFRHLPRESQVNVEAVCLRSKRRAFIDITTSDYEHITLTLQNTSEIDYDEYGPDDKGYYAI